MLKGRNSFMESLLKTSTGQHWYPTPVSDYKDNLKLFYYRGLKEWNNEKGYLTDTCLTAQDRYKACLDYFRI